jgi:hypothetical protein
VACVPGKLKSAGKLYSGVYLYELRGIQCGNHGGEFWWRLL